MRERHLGLFHAAPGRVLLGAMMVVAGLAGITANATAQDGRQPAGEDPILQALISEALARNPDLAAAHGAISAAQTRHDQVGALPDPMASIIYTNDGWAPSLGSQAQTTLGVMVSQEFPYPGKRQARVNLAMSEARQSEPALERARLSITAAVKRAYYGLQLARELVTITDEQRSLWRQIEVVTRNRYAAGEGAQQEVLRVQVEVTRIEQRAFEQASEIDLKVAELNRLLARPIDSKIATAPGLSLRPLSVPLPLLIDQARTVSPELAEARLAVETERSVLTLANLDFKPDFSVQGSYMNRGGMGPMWLAGVGVTWPLNKKKRESAVAESQLRSDRDQRVIESIDLQLRLRTQERYTRAKTAEKIIDLYDQGILPQGRMTVESAIANYQSGRVPFIAVLEAMTALYSDRWTRESLAANHAGLLASIEEASLDATGDLASSSGGMATPSSSGARGAAAGGMGGQ